LVICQWYRRIHRLLDNLNPLDGSAPARSDFFNYTKCRVGDVIYINFIVTNKANATVHYLNSSVTYDTVLFSNGTMIYSNQIHSSEGLLLVRGDGGT
jgi:hypothetical protein